MFARIVSLQLKPNARREFMDVLDNQIMPALRKQDGFREEIVSVDPGGPEVVAMSLWDSKQTADAYNQTSYPELVKVLAKVIEPNPRVRTLEVAYSTLQKTAQTVAA